MNVLVLGHGGREHALVECLKKSNHVNQVFTLNGNPGMLKQAFALEGEENHEHILKLCQKYHIDLVIPGSETYLSSGITDYLSSFGILVFGPTKHAAFIETSKAYAKMIMEKAHVPTGYYCLFHSFDLAYAYCQSQNPPYVIKYDGLAFGKGVTIAHTLKEAETVLKELLENRLYGDDQVLIEEYLEGEEYSMICLVHNQTVVPLPLAKDHKPRYDGNQGPNTGGMGAYTPVDFVDPMSYEKSLNMIKRVAHQMVDSNNPFTGFLYGGFILTQDGPKIIEFNCRLGDPEAEVILPSLKSDLIDLIQHVIHQKEVCVMTDSFYHVGVVLVSDGYPGSYQQGIPLVIPKEIEAYVYHMGTALKDNHLITHGGRVLLVRGTGENLNRAKDLAYLRIASIKENPLKYRQDIGSNK